jgi:hypothetical protein
MTDPTRWIDNPSEIDDIELRALRAARSVQPRRQMRQEVWAALAARLPPPGNPSGDDGGATGGDFGTGTNGATAAGASGGSHAASPVVAALKSMAIGAGLGATLSLGASWLGGASAGHTAFTAQDTSASLSSRSSAEKVATPAPVEIPGVALHPPVRGPAATPPPPQRAPSEGAVSETHSEALRPQGSVAAFALAEGTTSASRTRAETDARAESRLIAAARDALRANDVAGALRLLARARRQFPSGILAQEREALSVEALVRSDQLAAARFRAQEFLRAFPASPHTARVQAALERAH